MKIMCKAFTWNFQNFKEAEVTRSSTLIDTQINMPCYLIVKTKFASHQLG